MFAQWDDHEVTNNWYSGRALDADQRYTREERRRSWPRAACARSSNTCPIRQHADEPRARLPPASLRPAARRLHARHAQLSRPQHRNRQTEPAPETAVPRQRPARWLKRALLASQRHLEGDRRRHAARPDRLRRPRAPRRGVRGRGPRRHGPAARPRARDRRPAALHQATTSIRNTVWLTADVHYTAAHHYDPDSARSSRTSSRSGSSSPAR